MGMFSWSVQKLVTSAVLFGEFRKGIYRFTVIRTLFYLDKSKLLQAHRHSVSWMQGAYNPYASTSRNRCPQAPDARWAPEKIPPSHRRPVEVGVGLYRGSSKDLRGFRQGSIMLLRADFLLCAP